MADSDAGVGGEKARLKWVENIRQFVDFYDASLFVIAALSLAGICGAPD